MSVFLAAVGKAAGVAFSHFSKGCLLAVTVLLASKGLIDIPK